MRKLESYVQFYSNMVTRTINPIHFEDLEPHRFEDLIRQLMYDFKDWKSIEATGKLGSDDGIDILAIENNFEESDNYDDDNYDDNGDDDDDHHHFVMPQVMSLWTSHQIM